MIRTRIGMEVYGTNTELEKREARSVRRRRDKRVVTFEFECDLCPQFYTITAASHDPDGVWHDWMEDAVGIQRRRYAIHGRSGEPAGAGYLLSRMNVGARPETVEKPLAPTGVTHVEQPFTFPRNECG